MSITRGRSREAGRCEGGGALISQAIHQVDVLLYLMGAVDEVFGYWQLGAAHKIESEDCVCAVMRYASGATGVIQAATALWPGYPERVEIHGTKGSAIVTGDQLTAWDVRDDSGEAAPLAQQAKSGASDPMAISTTPFRTTAHRLWRGVQGGTSAVLFRA